MWGLEETRVARGGTSRPRVLLVDDEYDITYAFTNLEDSELKRVVYSND
jgi:hypothetical protein